MRLRTRNRCEASGARASLSKAALCMMPLREECSLFVLVAGRPVVWRGLSPQQGSRQKGTIGINWHKLSPCQAASCLMRRMHA